MVRGWQSVVVLLGVLSMATALFSSPAAADASQLDPYFYSETCPELFSIVADEVFVAILNESRIAASLLRLHFHDCFVQGCDASILLDGTTANPSEKGAPPNLNSVRGYSTIDTIKAAVESYCPNTVSCADIVTLAAFFSVVLSGGPLWWVPLGRRDSLLPNFALTTSNLPAPFLDVSGLKQKFDIQNLTTTDLVALSGGHTIGLARCFSVTVRLYDYLNVAGQSDPNINSSLLKALEKTCPNGGNANITTDLDIQTPVAFDNLYFQNLLKSNGVLNSDSQLVVGGASDTKALVQAYAANQTLFFEDFANSMIKMGNLNVSTGTEGQIRENCHVPNSASLESMASVQEKSPVKKVVERAEKLAEGTLQQFKEEIEKVLLKLAREKFQNLVVEDIIDGVHSSM